MKKWNYILCLYTRTNVSGLIHLPRIILLIDKKFLLQQIKFSYGGFSEGGVTLGEKILFQTGAVILSSADPPPLPSLEESGLWLICRCESLHCLFFHNSTFCNKWRKRTIMERAQCSHTSEASVDS